MKRFLLIFALISLPACAFENYVIITETPYRKVNVLDDTIVKAKPVYTLYNDKNIIIVNPVNSGKTKIIIDYSDKRKVIDTVVTKDRTILKPQSGLDFLSIDNPPMGMELPKPPVYRDIVKPPMCDGANNNISGD